MSWGWGIKYLQDATIYFIWKCWISDEIHHFWRLHLFLMAFVWWRIIRIKGSYYQSWWVSGIGIGNRKEYLFNKRALIIPGYLRAIYRTIMVSLWLNNSNFRSTCYWYSLTVMLDDIIIPKCHVNIALSSYSPNPNPSVHHKTSQSEQPSDGSVR